jgi:hypothetical protein
MIKGIDNAQNKEKIAIVAIGYNRQKALARMLDSVNSAYYNSNDIPLVISIDASEDYSLYNFVNEYKWKHGTKYVNVQKKRLGLKEHIFQCFSLSKYFKAVIILEDDLFVSPYFYDYAMATVDKYGEDEKVAAIALYKNEYEGFSCFPLQHIHNGADVFAWQTVCSWGEIVNERMWNNISKWLESFNDNFEPFDMCDTIKGWTRAWSKYIYAYMLQTDTYFIYPYIPLTTNFNDVGGEHGGGNSSLVQVSLLQGFKKYDLPDFSDLEHYDVYGHNMMLASWLNLKPSELSVDFYGNRSKYFGRYILTPFKLPYQSIKSFGLAMRPWELNIKYNIGGDVIYLYDRGVSRNIDISKKKFNYNYISYHLGRYIPNIGIKILINVYGKKIKQKIKLFMK